MDVTLTFRKSELGVVKLSRNLSPNFHPVSFGSEKLQNTNPRSSVLKFLQNQDYRNLPRNFSGTFWNIRLELPLTAALGIAT